VAGRDRRDPPTPATKACRWGPRLEDDKQRPRKQRHTAKRIFERLRAEHAYAGGYTIVKDYVRSSKIGGQEMFIPLTHAPGEAQADFGEALAMIAGVEQKAHFMVFDLPHSENCFVQAFPAETTEAFLEAHVRAFEYFGGVPARILYDNTTLAVARILGDGQRQKMRAFSELLSHYLFAVKFGRPAKGNDKGKVENLVGYARRNFMVPIPHAVSWEALNEQFIRDAMARRAQRLRGHRETIGERFERDRAVLLALPAARFEACDKTTARVSSISLVRYRTNDYSVPTKYGHRQVLVKAYVHRIVVVAGCEVIAEHQRSYEREVMVYDPLHYLALLEHKSRALDQAAPLAGWQLPECFATLRRKIEARLKKHAGREYIQVLRLLETFALDEVTHAIEDALQWNTISFDAVRHLVLCRIERRPPRMDMAMCRYRRPAPSCSSKPSANATNAPRHRSPATCPSTSGLRSSAPSGSPARGLIASPTTSTSWR
jgi:transposase